MDATISDVKVFFLFTYRSGIDFAQILLQRIFFYYSKRKKLSHLNCSIFPQDAYENLNQRGVYKRICLCYNLNGKTAFLLEGEQSMYHNKIWQAFGG
jgi:hypothetical protein